MHRGTHVGTPLEERLRGGVRISENCGRCQEQRRDISGMEPCPQNGRLGALLPRR